MLYNKLIHYFSGFLNGKTRKEQIVIQKQLISSIIAAKVIESGDKDSKKVIVSKFIDKINPDDIADKRLRDFITQAKRQISKADDLRYREEVSKLNPVQRKSILQLAKGMAKAYALDVIATRPQQTLNELDLFSPSSSYSYSSVFVGQPVRVNNRGQDGRGSSQQTGISSFDGRSSSFSFQPQVGQQRWGLSRSAFTPTGSNETGRGETASAQPPLLRRIDDRSG